MRITSPGHVLYGRVYQFSVTFVTLSLLFYSQWRTVGVVLCVEGRYVCPHCNTILHVRRAVCGCGHAFPSKRKACNDKMIAAKRARVRESQHEVSLRKEQDRLSKASIKSSETCEQTLHRQEQERVCKASMRASETSEQTLNRQGCSLCAEKVGTYAMTGALSSSYILIADHYTVCAST